MDLPLYISLVQNRMFLALAGLLCAFFFDVISGALLRHHADPRPLLERVADMVLYPFVSRLNRAGRAESTLFMRGSFILAIGCALFFGVIAYSLKLATEYGYGGSYITLLVAFSTGTVGWFAPMRALGRALNDPAAPRPYLVLARATYSNLVTLDDGGLIRVAATAAIRSLIIRMAAPIILYVLFGWQVLALYWPVMYMAQVAGQDGTNRNFAVIANGLAAIALLLPTLLVFPIVLASLFFSAGASFFRALPGLVRVTRWPPLVQGGLPLMLVAYAMKLMLAGPRQDRNGTPVAAGWVGPSGGTARLTARDIGRILYLQAVTLLLLASALYILDVLFQP